MRALNARIPTANYRRPRRPHGDGKDTLSLNVAILPSFEEVHRQPDTLGSINTQLLPFKVPVSSGQALSIWCLCSLKEQHLAFAGKTPFNQTCDSEFTHYSDDMQKVLKQLAECFVLPALQPFELYDRGGACV